MSDEQVVASDGSVVVSEPTPIGAKGPVVRDSSGRFAPGHCGGPGNPHFKALSTWRAALAAKVTRDDIEHVISVLVKSAREGERWAVTELLDRCLGRPVQHTVVESDDAGPRYKILIGIDEGEL